MVHENSLKAFRELEPEKRAQMILRVYENSSIPLTDREVMTDLGFSEMNFVRPRITELHQAGLLVECKKDRDSATGRTVRTSTIATPQNTSQLAFAL